MDRSRLKLVEVGNLNLPPKRSLNLVYCKLCLRKHGMIFHINFTFETNKSLLFSLTPLMIDPYIHLFHSFVSFKNYLGNKPGPSRVKVGEWTLPEKNRIEVLTKLGRVQCLTTPSP